MKSLPKEEKPVVGRLLNEIRTAVTAAIETRAENFRAEKESATVANIDVSLPGTAYERGAIHPLTQMLDGSIAIFRRMGFALAEGPDIDTEWNCFDALNTPADHPARNEQDTFYLRDGRLLRTHTSTVQIRTMESAPPPIRVIAPGAAYRRDEVDATHSAQFHQIEGLYVDEKVSVGDLKGTLEFFLRYSLYPLLRAKRSAFLAAIRMKKSRHPQRSRGIPARNVQVTARDSSTALGMTEKHNEIFH